MAAAPRLSLGVKAGAAKRERKPAQATAGKPKKKPEKEVRFVREPEVAAAGARHVELDRWEALDALRAARLLVRVAVERAKLYEAIEVGRRLLVRALELLAVAAPVGIELDDPKILLVA